MAGAEAQPSSRRRASTPWLVGRPPLLPPLPSPTCARHDGYATLDRLRRCARRPWAGRGNGAAYPLLSSLRLSESWVKAIADWTVNGGPNAMGPCESVAAAAMHGGRRRRWDVCCMTAARQSAIVETNISECMVYYSRKQGRHMMPRRTRYGSARRTSLRATACCLHRCPCHAHSPMHIVPH